MSSVPISFDQGLFWDDVVQHDPAGHAYRHDKTPGASEWSRDGNGNIAALIYMCPCGCGNISAVPVNKDEKLDKMWRWDGDELLPTLTPSIQKTSPCKWHGYLTKGVFVSV